MASNNYESPPCLDNSADLFESDDNGDADDLALALMDVIKPEEESIESYFRGTPVDNPTPVDEHSASRPLSDHSHHVAQLTTAPTFSCPFCNVVEKSVIRLESHIETSHSEMGEETGKKTEPTESTNVDQFTKNLADWLGVPYPDADDVCIDDVESCVIYCPVCDQKLENLSALEPHLESIHKEELEGAAAATGLKQCPICYECFSSESDLKNHVETHLSSSHASSLPSDTPSSSSAGSQSKCPVCDFENHDYAIMVSHVESHFDPSHAPGTSDNGAARSNSQDFSSSRASNSTRGQRGRSNPNPRNSVYQSQYQRNLERSVMRGDLSPSDYHERMLEMNRSSHSGIDEGHSRVDGLYERISAAYTNILERNVFLCDPTDYYCGSYGDKGWGCGFRNLQMLISCLIRIPLYAEKLFPDGNPQVPSVGRLQQMIEGAWRKGFDLEGRTQLKGKLVGTQTWIGATEVVATLSSMGIKCVLADFHRPSAGDGSHPRLLEWVRDYFTSGSANKPPLYLQHQGHSRTIAGVEADNGFLTLIMFDPGMPHERVADMTQRPFGKKQLISFRKTQSAFKARQYQVVSVVGTLTPQEYEDSKVLYSTQVS